MHPHLQLQGVLFAGKRVREGVHLAIGEREILGCDIRSIELHQRHGFGGCFCGETWKKKHNAKTSVPEAQEPWCADTQTIALLRYSVSVCVCTTQNQAKDSSSFIASQVVGDSLALFLLIKIC